MSDTRRAINDEDLLADAIPIDLEEEEEADELAPIEVDLSGDDVADAAEDPSASQSSTKIHQFEQTIRKAHADHWNRTPNATGTGAIHVKTFVAKLRMDAIDNLDDQVNQWLDAHPEYEVKFVTTSIGKLVGKISEEAIFMNVWV